MTSFELPVLALIALVSFGLSYVGAAVGLVLGQLRLVLLTYALGSAAEGTATSLAISTVATVIGAAAHAREGRVYLPLMFTVGLPSAAAAYFTTRYAGTLDPQLVKSAIALTLLLTGVQMLRRGGMLSEPPPGTVPRAAAPAIVFAYQIVVGAVLGAISGLVGLLLGTLRLPAMMRLGGRASPASAVGTNMAIGAVTGLSAGVSACTGGHLNMLAFAVVSPLTLLGSHLGAKKTGQMDERILIRWIAYTLIPTALFMLSEVGLELGRRVS